MKDEGSKKEKHMIIGHLKDLSSIKDYCGKFQLHMDNIALYLAIRIEKIAAKASNDSLYEEVENTH